MEKILLSKFFMLKIEVFLVFHQKQGYFAFFVMTAGQLDQETELLHEELHHPLGTRHLVFRLHVDVSEKSFQEH